MNNKNKINKMKTTINQIKNKNKKTKMEIPGLIHGNPIIIRITRKNKKVILKVGTNGIHRINKLK